MDYDYNLFDIEGIYMNLEIEKTLNRLEKSKFRSSFHLTNSLKEYTEKKGIDVIISHTEDFVEKRLSPAIISNDGKQTPMKGHPTFVAQHATATCCRSCLEKWHHIPKGRALTKEEQQQITSIL